ncbi:Beta-lactamase domain protein precursor [Devosia sp. LC5]|uniref:MBL fold metallo-hydrolase n=1 Tax=Devosia sp. LC5 TaxID=1502724 RepID=UPI0004E2978F|nr:MBL fold metallo-hydrolase [Devosia sp. LC5]KFC66229.1 Beta-lactamase domain protein precursor [Devosia sp. LC5]
MRISRRNVLAKGGAATLAGLTMPAGLTLSAAEDAQPAWTIGDFRITPLLDGVVEVDETIFTDADPAARRDLLEDAGQPEGKIRLDVNTFLIERGDTTILVDTGTRDLYGPTLGKLPAALAAAGVDPSDIQHVILTHMHNDHVGGLVDGNGKSAFANAQLHVAEAEWTYWTSEDNFASATAAGQFSFAGARAATPLYQDRVQPFSGTAEILPGIHPIALPGHSLAHTGFRLTSGADQLIIWGDVVVSPELQFAHPEWTSTFDADPAQAAQSRMQIFREVAADQIPVLGMHLPFPGAGTVLRNGDAYELTAL